MTGKKNAAPVLEHRDGKKRQVGHEPLGTTYMVYSPRRGVKSFLLASGAAISAMVSAWWLCAIIEGTAGGVTGPLVLAGVCAWLARALARAAERGYIDGRPQRKN